ncbi:MAG: SPOR domain-containing protein [Deltaproteobacteria bacterium]|nr:SPOR domain-containing protein [Deltaproteobacteria bacterium]
MKVSVRNILVCLVLFAFCIGCSGNEEPPPPAKKPRVVKRIIKPPPRPVQTSAPQQEPVARPEKKEAEAQPQKKEEAQKTAPPPLQKLSKPAAPPVKPKPPEAKEEGVYVVKKGESLSGIAKKPEVYGDPLKWTVLYRMNLDKVGQFGKGADLPGKGLKEGLRLKVITPEEGKKNLEKQVQHFWIVNILSATDPEKIVPAAVTLIQKGYPVYITMARVKGKDWMRLRLGFYKDKKSAAADGKKVVEILRFSGSWATKIPEEELKDNGRF